MNEPNPKNTTNPVNRRRFIKSSSAAVGGAMMGSLALRQGVFADHHDTLKVALIGCGGRGTGAANQALSTEGPVKLVAMADAFRDRLNSSHDNLKKNHADRMDVPEDHKFVGFDGYKHATALADVVILATPPGFRPIHFEHAIERNKHVFMEKPVAVDGPGVRKVLAAAAQAKAKNLKVGVGLQRHHQKGYIETIDRIHGGAIGDPVAMRCYWNGSGVWVRGRKPEQTEMEYQMRNWYYFNWLCGDHIVEQHIHNLDVINWVKNAFPVRAQGMGGREVRDGKDHGQIFDHHAVEFIYADGSRCFSYCRHIPGCWSSVSEHVIGTKGTSDVNRHTISSHDGWNQWRHDGRGDKNPYQQEHDDLFRAIRNDLPYNEAEYGAKSTLTSILGRYCTYSGKMIEWEEALHTDKDLSPERYAWDAEPPVTPNSRGDYPVPVPGKTVTV